MFEGWLTFAFFLSLGTVGKGRCEYMTENPINYFLPYTSSYLGLKFLKCYLSLSRYIFPPAFNHNFIVVANFFKAVK